MKILDLLTSAWAIQPEKLIELQGIYATHLRGEKIDIAGVEARLGKPLNKSPQGYDVTPGGVAVVPVEGVIAKKMNLFSQVSGGASTEMVARDVKAAAADPKVKSILLYIDSPGGTVDGTQTLADLIMAVSAQKPVVAFADGMMASAAYWIGSAANSVIAASDTTQVGSIGVVATHKDVSGAEAKDGVKTTEISAGKYKRIASSYSPLSEDGMAHMQGQVDALYTIFVNDVADQRGVSTDKVLSDMADGRVFLGQDAVKAGLVDRIASLDTVIAEMEAGNLPPLRNSAAGVAAVAQKTHAAGAVAELQPSIKGKPMDLATLRAEHPALAEALIKEGHQAGLEAGATAERQRIQDVEAQHMPGHEALIASLKFDGKTSGAEAAVQVLNAERGKLGAHATALRSDAVKPVQQAAAPEESAASASADPEAEIKATWDKDASIRAEFGTFETYKAYATALASGQVKTLRSKE